MVEKLQPGEGSPRRATALLFLPCQHRRDACRSTAPFIPELAGNSLRNHSIDFGTWSSQREGGIRVLGMCQARKPHSYKPAPTLSGARLVGP